MKIVLFDLPNEWSNLLPLTFTRPISNIRLGIFTLKERWQQIFPTSTISSVSVDYLNNADILDIEDEMLYINSSCLPNHKIIGLIKKLDTHKGLCINNQLIAYKGYIKYHPQSFHFPYADVHFAIHHQNPHYQKALLQSEDISEHASYYLQYPYQIFLWNEKMLTFDFENFIINKPKGLLNSTNKLIGPEKNLFISPYAKIEGSIINTQSGYVFIDDDAEIMEGSLIRGPFCLGKGAVLKMGTKIYGATTIGPYSKVGGEINNSIFFAYSNKAHDGFIGNSVIGEWCNLGADTNNSNLKNNYGEVKIFNYTKDELINTHMQFCGMIMGDHSKTGINSMINTGSIIGVAANIFGAGFTPKHIPSFTWGGINDTKEYTIEKLFNAANEMMKRRQLNLSEKEKNILIKVKEITEYHRKKLS